MTVVTITENMRTKRFIEVILLEPADQQGPAHANAHPHYFDLPYTRCRQFSETLLGSVDDDLADQRTGPGADQTILKRTDEIHVSIKY